MVVETKEDVLLHWDAFLEKVVLKQAIGTEDVRQGQVKNVRRHIDSFRAVEWRNIKRDLARAPYNWQMPEGLEPHWVAPGRAVFWQPVVVREIVDRTDSDGQKIRVFEDVQKGWAPTDSGVPANNPSVIAHYLDKGLRFRPPRDGVSDEVLKSAVPSDAFQEPDKVLEPAYRCDHGRDKYVFNVWKAYREHCRRYKELPQFDPPAEIMETRESYPYFCDVHGKGFRTKRTAGKHVQAEKSRRISAPHATVEQMEVKADVEG
jgi:hypothetical protein